MAENKEEREASSYYAYKVEQLQTRAHITTDDNPVRAQKTWMDRAYFMPERMAMLDSEKWCSENEDARISITVEDNGSSGDGLWLRLCLDDCHLGLNDGTDGDLVGISLTPKQAALLGQALLSAVRMREREG